MLKFSCEKRCCKRRRPPPASALPRKAPSGAEGLLLEGGDGLTLSGYNTQTGIRTRLEADVREEGHIVLNARLFGDIIRRMPDDMIVFSADEKLMVHLSCGDASFDILGLSARRLPRAAGGGRPVRRRHTAENAESHDRPDGLRRLHQREPPRPYWLPV